MAGLAGPEGRVVMWGAGELAGSVELTDGGTYDGSTAADGVELADGGVSEEAIELAAAAAALRPSGACVGSAFGGATRPAPPTAPPAQWKDGAVT